MNITSCLSFAASAAGVLLAGIPVGVANASWQTSQVYGYDDLYGVPRLGDETVAGTGCGRDGSIGDVIPFDQPDTAIEVGEDSWVRIVNGQAQWIVSGCATPDEIGPWTPQPQPRPGSGLTFPYADFWDVPQLGSEPVHGTGCGADGSLGDTMPDGLWFGWIDSTTSSSLQFDVACAYHGPLAEQLCVAEYPPDYGSPPCWGSGIDALFVDNNSERTRAVPLAPGYVAADAVIEVVEILPGDMQRGRCAPPADPLDHGDNGMGVWLSIQNGQAQYSLQECLHD